ncbi:MAG: amidohydrolase [Armatimonadetes bacterium]|nr:amidohydrolase [Armatimonadota bacterium]
MTKAYVNGRTIFGAPLSFSVANGRFVEVTDGASPKADETVDLAAAVVLPGFVDAHCHILPTGLDLLKLDLTPHGTREEMLEAVADWHRERPDGWLLAVQYDQTRFSDSVHLTRDDIDRVVSDRPVLLRHSSGHASVANSKALEVAGVAEDVADPNGGAFVRDASGRLTGVLLERAHETVTAKAPEPTLEEMTDAVLRAGEKMAALGITCATDMMTGRWNLERELTAYKSAAEKGCAVRIRLFAQWGTVLGRRALDQGRLDELTGAMDPASCRLEGLKIFADGAIGSATAAIYGSFLTTGGDGQLIYAPDRFKDMVRTADGRGYRLAVHTIGDRSTDLVMSAYEETADARRHRVEHAMLLSDGQIARLARLDPSVTMQPEFLLRFGHAYMKQLGPERAATIKRTRSVLDAGLRLSFSSDRPIVPGDPWDGIRSAVDRPSGFDPSESVSLEEAVRMATKDGAGANGDDDQGAIVPGHRADFQVYAGNPGDSAPVSVYVSGHMTAGRP